MTDTERAATKFRCTNCRKLTAHTLIDDRVVDGVAMQHWRCRCGRSRLEVVR